MLWGTEERLRELLGGEIDSLETMRRSFVFRYRSFGHYLDALKTRLGPTRSAFEALGPEERRSLEAGIQSLVQSFNVSGDETMIVPAEYLEIVAYRR